MNISVVKVSENDSEIINSIVEKLLDNESQGPSIIHLNKLLTDDRTYLFAAFLGQEIIGYALAYRFPSLYASTFLAYLYDIEVLKAHRRKGAGRLLIQTLLIHF